MTATQAKFEREQKERPADWVIAPVKGLPGSFRLVCLPNVKRNK